MSAAKRRKLDDGRSAPAGGDASPSSPTNAVSFELNSSRHLAWSSDHVLARALPSTGTSLICVLSRLPGPKERHVQPARLSIPVRRPGEEIHRLVFAPRAGHLLIATCFPRTEEPTLLTSSSAGLRLVLFEQGVSACWQDWHILHEWVIETAGPDAGSIADLQWLDERPAFGLPTRSGEAFLATAEPRLRAQGGLAFAVVLASDEVLFCRFDAVGNAAPILLRTWLSREGATILIAPSAPLADDGHLGLDPAPMSTTLSALVGSSPAEVLISHAAIGFPPQQPVFLVAARHRRRPNCRPIAEPALSDLEEALAAVVPPLSAPPSATDESHNMFADLDPYSAFSGLGSLENLDEAFGDLDEGAKEASVAPEKSGHGGIEPDLTLDGPEAVLQNTLAMYAISVQWNHEGGPKLNVDRLPALPLTTASDASHTPESLGSEELAALSWLARDQKDAGLTLVAVSNARDQSRAQQWRAEYLVSKLCAAFDNLQGKKVKNKQLEHIWVFVPGTSQIFMDRQTLSLHKSGTSPTEAFIHALDVTTRSTSLVPIDIASLPQSAQPLPSVFQVASILVFSASSCLIAGLSQDSKVIFISRPGGPSTAQHFSAILALNVRRGLASGDVYGAVSALLKSKKGSDISKFGRELMQATSVTLRTGLKVEEPIARSTFTAHLLRVHHALLQRCGSDAHREHALLLCRLWAIAKNFGEACAPSRTGANMAYDLHAAWPLIASAVWYAKFAVRLLRALVDQHSGSKNAKELPEDLFLLLHPFCLAAHRRISAHIAEFATFIERYDNPPEDNIFPIARAVLSDVISGSASGTMLFKMWQAILAGLSQPQASLPLDLPLETLELPQDLPEGLRISAEKAVEILASVTSASLKGREPSLDVITMANLGPTHNSVTRRQCLQCGGVSDLPSALHERSVEVLWRRRCICGGMWSLQA